MQGDDVKRVRQIVIVLQPVARNDGCAAANAVVIGFQKLAFFKHFQAFVARQYRFSLRWAKVGPDHAVEFFDRVPGLAHLAAGVCVAVTPTLAAFAMPPVIHRFAALCPDIRVVVDNCAPDQFMSRVIGEHVDFGIGTPEKMLADADLQTLMPDHLSLVCTPDHALAKQKSVRWADLAGHPVITVRPAMAYTR